MKRFFVCFLLLLLPLVLVGCGDGNPAAPPDNNAHATEWLKTHPASALATANFADCTSCHADNLEGSAGAVSCYSCHTSNTDANFTIHPTTWLTAYSSHRGSVDTTTCAKCHGADLQGSVAAPSCFSSSIDGVGSCHPAGPGLAIHLLDGSFLAGATHGPIAKLDLVVCQGCHAQPGGAGSNPRFNLGVNGINNVGDGTGCEYCHGELLAHPANWDGYNGPSFHGTSGNMQNACVLCHGVNLDGVGGVGTSCFSCHGTNPLQ